MSTVRYAAGLFVCSTIVSLAFGCGSTPGSEPKGDSVTKEEAEQNQGRAEDGSDYCAENAWYGDGTCDEWCPDPDPDCGGGDDSTGCSSSSDCGDGQYCQVEGGCPGGDEAGTCTDAPEVCTEEYAPVCGCDGETYANACKARTSGVSVGSSGECDDGGGDGSRCRSDDDCAGDAYCAKAGDRACSSETTGTCKIEPEVCTEEYAPVCGCDGETYGNDCKAASAGVSVDHVGECDSGPAGCTSDEECATGEFCQKTGDQSCGADTSGTCQAIPAGCGEEWDPVCGCDGETYGNACEAEAAGASVDHEGECESDSSGCRRDDDCQEGEYCSKTDGRVCSSETTGACRATPDICTEEYAPVCGCDGETYGNRCKAASQGVNVAYAGECDSGGGSGTACTSNGDCGSEEFCKKEGADACSSDVEGACVGTPDTCTQQYDPVCGCDGETYSNQCSAEAAGVNVASDGECQDSGDAGCTTNEDCGSGEFCRKTSGDVCSSNASGSCDTQPDACPTVYDPVCGCDRNTYSNECRAAAAGVNVVSSGQCS